MSRKNINPDPTYPRPPAPPGPTRIDADLQPLAAEASNLQILKGLYAARAQVDQEFIAALLSALEYHAEQTRPIHSTTLAIEAARDYLKYPPCGALK